MGLVHARAGARLAEDAQQAGAEPQQRGATLGEVDTGEQHVGTPAGRGHHCGELALDGLPHFGLDQRHLPAPALIGVAGDTATGDQLDARRRVHRPAMVALDPESLDGAHERHHSAPGRW